MDKDDSVHIHNGVALSHRKNEIMPFAAAWMDPKIIILNEGSRKVRDKRHDISCMCNLTYDTDELAYKTEADLQV